MNTKRGRTGGGFPAPVALVDSQGQQITDVVPSIVTTEVDHWLIHKGVAFQHADVHMVTKSGGANNILEYIFQNTNVEKEVHLTEMHVESLVGEGVLEFFRGVTSDDMGTPEPMNNKNHKSANTSLLTLGHTPTNVATPTDALRTWFITSDKKQAGTSGRGIDEFVIAENVKYLIRYTNNSTTTDDNVVVVFSDLEVGQL